VGRVTPAHDGERGRRGKRKKAPSVRKYLTLE
jgi:hypothetical protein